MLRHVRFLLVAAIFAGAALATPNVYIKDTPLDSGVEPNPDSGPMWISQDIWVRQEADPGYRPYPFPEGAPPWTPLPHQPAEYRDPKFGHPNYVYVRVHNNGTTASTGTERLRVYFAKASTGLSWPAQWVDFVASNCGPTKLYGGEITKPRLNAATASSAEQTAYVNAIVKVGTLPSFFFGTTSYWHKQNDVHSLGPMTRHGTPAFLPWHREFVNRYEALLQEADPTVKLLYWDWTTDPENSTGGGNLFTPSFMGFSGRGTGGVNIGPPFQPALGAPGIVRNLSPNTTPPANSDSTVLAPGDFDSFWFGLEQSPNHNDAHGYIGGGGNINFINFAAQDPFFFLLHANVDRLWAQWQRQQLSRRDPTDAYDLDQGDGNITADQEPWNGTGFVPIDPYLPGNLAWTKTSTDSSVVAPPAYDTATLTVPPLAPGEAVIVEIPWYPPNPGDFSCFGIDQNHFCLLARLETAPAAPFGMTVPESADIGANTRNNRQIAWKNITVADNFTGAMKTTSIIVRNPFKEPIVTTLKFADTAEIGTPFSSFGRIVIDPVPQLLFRWLDRGALGRGIRQVPFSTTGGQFVHVEVVSPEATMENILLEPGEAFGVNVTFELARDYRLPRGAVAKWDFMQLGAPGQAAPAVIGGQRFEIDFTNIVPVPAGGEWLYLDDGSDPGPNWRAGSFDDSEWKTGRADFGFGGRHETTLDPGPPDRRHVTAYFRRQFFVSDPTFFRSLILRLRRDDGAVVYLNGTEIHRANVPAGAGNLTLATKSVGGVEEEVFFPTAVPLSLLRAASNILAVELHQDSFRAGDAAFDLELSANRSFPNFAPNVLIASPRNGSLAQSGQAIPVLADALDSDGSIRSVSFFADGKLLATDEAAPFAFNWTGAPLGRHRLRVVATDSSAQATAVDAAVTVVANTPPAVRLTQPGDGMFARGQVILATAEAADPGGRVDRVEFYLHQGERFDAPRKLVGTVRTPPYTIALTGLASDHYMLTAWAIDDRGLRSVSNVAHFHVHETAGPVRRRPAKP